MKGYHGIMTFYFKSMRFLPMSPNPRVDKANNTKYVYSIFSLRNKLFNNDLDHEFHAVTFRQ